MLGSRLTKSIITRGLKVTHRRESSIANSANVYSILKRLRNVDTTSICDAHKAAPLVSLRVMGPEMVPMNAPISSNSSQPSDHFKLVGFARTVQCTEPNDFLAVLRGLKECGENEVLVVNTQDSTRAVAGGLFITEAARKNMGGIVIDGPVRDISALRHSVIPMFAKSITPYSGWTQSAGQTQVEIMCGGVKVQPGDLIVGDADGLVVGSMEAFGKILESAENIAAMEDRLMEGMLAGKNLHSFTNFDEHLGACQQGKKSSLEFRFDE